MVRIEDENQDVTTDSGSRYLLHKLRHDANINPLIVLFSCYDLLK